MPRKKGVSNATTSSKKKKEPSEEENIQIQIEPPQPEVKKRGRKPKGGKLIVKDNKESNEPPVPTNVILHLKCSLKDVNNNQITSENNLIGDPMNYNASAPPTIQAYDHINDNKFFEFKSNDMTVNNSAYGNITTNVSNDVCGDCNNNELNEDTDNQTNMKDINMKLKKLKINLYKNNMDEKKSACFWCTYDFDNQTCYIPRYENNDEILGYGSFCRPECAVAYLMKENIDDSTKFERYHLLNSVYSKIYNYKNNIKPAPNPYFLLDKFYGNLNIQEYRKLLNSERILMVIDTPLTRILPELHEDTDDFTTGMYNNNKGVNTQSGGIYKVKRQSEKTHTVSKASIMKEKFGFTN